MTMPPVLSSANSPYLYCYDGVSNHTHSEVHKTQELLQHFCHDGEIAFWKMLSHSSHIYLRGDREAGEQRREYLGVGKESNRILCTCIRYSHLTALAEAAQQQGSVGGNNAVLHMLACMLQSYRKTQESTNMIHNYSYTCKLSGEELLNSFGCNFLLRCQTGRNVQLLVVFPAVQNSHQFDSRSYR